jgi:hypothetical protein
MHAATASLMLRVAAPAQADHDCAAQRQWGSQRRRRRLGRGRGLQGEGQRGRQTGGYVHVGGNGQHAVQRTAAAGETADDAEKNTRK